MAVTSWFFASSIASSGSGAVFINTANAGAANGAFTRSALGSGDDTQDLVFLGFGADSEIGATDTIDGFEVEWRGRSLDESKAAGAARKLIPIIGGAQTGTNQYVSIQYMDAIDTYTKGGAADLMGTAPTAAQVRDNLNFGFAMEFFEGIDAGDDTDIDIDYLKARIHYTPGAPAASGNNTMFFGL